MLHGEVYKHSKYSWGDEEVEKNQSKANTWQESFQVKNTGWYRPDYYLTLKGITSNPKGPIDNYDPMEPTILKKVVHGTLLWAMLPIVR